MFVYLNNKHVESMNLMHDHRYMVHLINNHKMKREKELLIKHMAVTHTHTHMNCTN